MLLFELQQRFCSSYEETFILFFGHDKKRKKWALTSFSLKINLSHVEHKRKKWFAFFAKERFHLIILRNWKMKTWFKTIATMFTCKLIHHIFGTKQTLLLFDTKIIKHLATLYNIIRFIYLKVIFQRQSYREILLGPVSICLNEFF